ncbi:MAG: hypothetical protein ASARMPREDX12_003154 [Alectoria sarmentosa]|nr:MAG: hypothetical protein ASARMPREDX12_003154 [Alectoria sarmentosa]
MSESARAPWTSARCNRLLRPLSSKIALLRKATLCEPRQDECNSRITPSSSSSKASTVVTKVDTEWEISPRPWKKIKRTYSSRTKAQSFRELVDYKKDRPFEDARDAVIRLPLHLTAGQDVGSDEALATRDGQYSISSQRAPPRAPCSTSKNLQNFHNSQVLGSTRTTRPSSRRLIEGICKALEALLRATTCEKTNDIGRCRSLFSICLRQTPNYIVEEQRRTVDEHPEHEIDVASEIYADLEAFGSAPDGGWESLREVVRAHGVSLVGEAVQEGLIELALSRDILNLCLGLAAYDEAECVVKSMIALVRARSLSPMEKPIFLAGLSQPVNKRATPHRLHAIPLTDETSLVADALKYYVLQSGRHGFMYRQMAVMLEDGILPVEWMSSKAMIECWNGVIHSITQQDDHAQSAALLLQVATSISFRRGFSNARVSPQVHDLRLRACESSAARPTLRSYNSGQAVDPFMESPPVGSGQDGARPDDIDNALQSTYSNILTVLSAFSILRLPRLALDSSHSDPLSVEILRSMALEIRQALEVAHVTSYANRRWNLSVELLHRPLLAAGLVSIASRKASTAISQNEVLDLAALASLPSSRESLSNAGSFLGQVAQCCDEAGSGNGFRFLQSMAQDLISIAVSNIYDKPTQRLCSGIAHVAAFAFSENTGRPRHLDWALDVDSTIMRTVDDPLKVVMDKTPARAVVRNKSGYRWEEGICEWIAKTPASALQWPAAIEEVDHDNTDGKAPKLTLVQALPLLSGASPCATDRRLPKAKRIRGERLASCDCRDIGTLKGSCGIFDSSEKLLSIRVSPRPQEVPRPQSHSKVNPADDLDELSTPDSSQEKPVALQEIPNLQSGVKRKSVGRKHKNKVTGSYKMNMPSTKMRRLDTEMFCPCTDDELGFS